MEKGSTSTVVTDSGGAKLSATRYLPPGLTPVNNFWLVFDAYFSAQLGRLPEVSYFSPYTAPFEFEVIPNTCAGE